MMKDLLIGLREFSTLLGSEFKLIKTLTENPWVPQITVKMTLSLFVPHNKPSIPSVRLFPQKGRCCHKIFRQGVLFQKRGQLPVGIKNVTSLVRPVESTFSQGIQQVCSLIGC